MSVSQITIPYLAVIFQHHQTIDDERNLYHCFACGAGGNIFRFVSELEGVSFVESVELLADQFQVPITFEQYGSSSSSSSGGSSINNTSSFSLARSAKKQHESALAAAAAWYARQLASSPSGGWARKHLRERWVGPSSAAHWGLGWAPAQAAANHELTKHLLGLGFDRETLVGAGILARKQFPSSSSSSASSPSSSPSVSSFSYSERFRGRLMVPIKDAQGKVVGFGGRRVDNSDDDDGDDEKVANKKEVKASAHSTSGGAVTTSASGGEGVGGRVSSSKSTSSTSTSSSSSSSFYNPKYLNTPETKLFRKRDLLWGLSEAKPSMRRAQLCVVVEGYFDALLLHEVRKKTKGDGK
jgi:DNA primase